jgi:DNA-binding CsgD family transcriptional regulator
VNSGEFWVSSEQLGFVVDALHVGVRLPIVNGKNVDLLTPREAQVVNLVADGLGNREIAQQLDIKENSIKKSLFRIYDKLGVSNRVELVLFALTHQRTSSVASGCATSPEVPPKEHFSRKSTAPREKDWRTSAP